MSHLSENAARLAVKSVRPSSDDALPAPDPDRPAVWLLVRPFGRPADDADARHWHERLSAFAAGLHPDSVLALLTSPADAATTWPALGAQLRFQLWVSVKLATPRAAPGRLPEHHAALLILSRYRGALRHTKTRVGYTYCPACDRTTKDYGGKKHTYHAYGTLLSDVWRDLAWEPGTDPEAVTDRLADLFGLPPYETLHVVSMATVAGFAPTGGRLPQEATRAAVEGPLRESRLLRGDCVQELARLPADSVDFCFADPPYNLSKRYDRCDDDLDVIAYFRWCDRWLGELARVLKPGRTCAVLNIPLWAMRHFEHMARLLTFQSWIVWEGLSLPVRRIMPAHYAIVCFSKGPPRPLPGGEGQDPLTALQEGYCLRAACVRARRADRVPLTDLWWDVHRLKHNSRRVDHPCQLPPALMTRLIALFTGPGEVVLDPFNGAGTTSLCAEMLGRRYVGIELSETYHQLSAERHTVLRSGGDPFARVQAVPRAKNSRVKRIGGVTYEVPKKTLQLEVRRIARDLGRLPTRDEVLRLSKYPIRYFDEYFINWGEVCAAARTTGMKERRDPRPDAD
jgi:site-specific DNA-methyltransferase (adenine-specific)